MGLEFLWMVFYASTAIQLFYLFIIFGRLAFFSSPSDLSSHQKTEGVSIVVAARNELKNLKALLPVLASQHYRQFEIVIVNDRSTDGTRPFLRKMMNVYPQLRTVTIGYTPSHVTAKKYALTLGIKVAKYDIILLTDADCLPVTDHWVEQMSKPLRADNDKVFVLGHGAYEKCPGLLNQLIQYETLITAVSYFSWALWKSPIMGVGRNMAYRKTSFMEKKAFKGFWQINGGDDDLLVNRYANGRNTSLLIEPGSITTSQPKSNWKSYFLQKTRHYHAGKYYNTGSKLRLGLYPFSQLVFWITAVLLLFTSAKGEPIAIILGLVVLRAFAQIFVLTRAKKKLEGEGMVNWMIFFDLPYLSYFWVVGSKGYLSKRIKWK